MVFVVGREFGTGASQLLRTRFDPSTQAWLPWQQVDLLDQDPKVDAELMDIDAAYDADGNCLLFALDRGEQTIAFANMTKADWRFTNVFWDVANVGYPEAATGDRLTALRAGDGSLWAITIDDRHQIQALATQCDGDPAGGWFFYPDVPNGLSIDAWKDVDLYWNKDGEARLLALPISGDFSLVQFQVPDRSCGDYEISPGVPAQPRNEVYVTTSLWNPTMYSRRPDIQTITGSRWLEDVPGVVSPLVFATDSSGNVYFIEYAQNHGGWQFGWKSFYNETIVY